MRSHSKRFYPRKQASKIACSISTGDTGDMPLIGGSLKPVKNLINELTRISLSDDKSILDKKPKKPSRRKYIF